MKNLILIFVMLLPFTITKAEQKHIVTSDGVDLFIEVKGSGVPCLYIHGGPGSGSYWMEKLFGDFLEQHFQMIYLDQRGASRSGTPKDSNFTMDRMVKDFEEVRSALGIKQWITMGHSFGGILQMGYAKQHPDVVNGMIMINCTLNLTESLTNSWAPKACEFLDITDTKPYLDESKPVFERLSGLISQLNEKKLFWKMGFAKKESEDIMNKTFWEIKNWNHAEENIIITKEEYLADFKKDAPGMNMPVLFFYGKSDWMIGPDHYKTVHFPNMLLWSSNVGHIPFIENKEDLQNAILNYLEKYKL